MSSESNSSAHLPMTLEPLMLTHLALTGDLSQAREWRSQIETIRQTEAVERERDPKARALLVRDRVWLRMRMTGKTGAATNLALSTLWMAWLIPTYAVGHGF